MKSAEVVSKPLVTMIILSYNQEKFIADAIDGAFSQNYENLEIIICDDCSNDKTLEIIKEKCSHYCGPHSVSFFETKKNGGVVKNFNFALEKSNGELLIATAGDDISYSNRASKAVEYYLKYGFSAFYSFANVINETGEKIDEWEMEIDKPFYPSLDSGERFEHLPFYGAGAVYNRKLFLRFGFIPDSIRNEDYNFFVRSLISDGVAYCKEPLLSYRKHANNLSYWVKIKKAQNIIVKARLKCLSLDNKLKNMIIAKDYISTVYGDESVVYESYDRLIYSCAFSCFLFSVISLDFHNPYSRIHELNYVSAFKAAFGTSKKIFHKTIKSLFRRGNNIFMGR